MKILSGLLGVLIVSTPAQAAMDPSAFRDLAFRQHPGAQLPIATILKDETGARVPLASELAGRPAVVVLEYLRCQNLCNLVLTGAVRSLRAAGVTPGRDVELIGISIDPRDTSADAAAAKARYAATFSDPKAASAGIHFLTGSPEDVARIAAAVGFPYRYDRASDQFAHPAGFVVATPDGKISRYMLGLDPRPALLRQAVAEAALEKVEPPAHPLLCLCFGYDPDEGSVAALTLRLVRWTSVAMILGLAVLIFLLSLRRRSV